MRPTGERNEDSEGEVNPKSNARMKIYLSGKFDAQERLRAEREWLLSHVECTVVSSWLDEVASDGDKDKWPEYAQRDLLDVMQADLFIIDTIDENNRGGREVELGYALAMMDMMRLNNKTRSVVVVGPTRNVFHTLADSQFDDWGQLREAFSGSDDATTQDSSSS